MKTLQFFDLKGQVSNENMEGRLSLGEFRKVLNAYAVDGDIHCTPSEQSGPLYP